MKQIVQLEDAPGGCPLTHTFSDGVYVREIFMPAGDIVVGHVHKTRHLNIITKGVALVWMNGEVTRITAPYTFESDAGVQKVLYIEEDMLWSTIHVTEETDMDKLEELLIDKEESKRLLKNTDTNKAVIDLTLLIGE